jgi:hypothetical protein
MCLSAVSLGTATVVNVFALILGMIIFLLDPHRTLALGAAYALHFYDLFFMQNFLCFSSV